MDYVDHTFSGATIDVDGHTFRRCTFENCKLSTDGGSFSFLERQTIIGTFKIDLAPGSASVIQLLDLFGRTTGALEIGGRMYRADDQIANQKPASDDG